MLDDLDVLGRECCSEISIGCFDGCCQIGFMSSSMRCVLVAVLLLLPLGLELVLSLVLIRSRNDTRGVRW